MTTLLSRGMALLLCSSFVLASSPEGFAYQTDQSAEPSGQSSVAPPPQAAQQTAEQLQQLVAPIALYPDALVAQILAASTYPAEIVEADRWMQQHTNLKGKQLADQVDQQSWDPSVKALTQFPSVLANLDKNLSWASSLGDAYVNQQKDVMDAVQVMRGRAKSSGNLKSTSQEKVTSQGQTIVIEPTNPDVVYVPQYDPWLVYGAPLGVWPGWYPFPGLYLGGPGISFGVGFGLGFFGGFGWGWGHWGFDWHNRRVLYNHRGWVSHSRTFANHNNFGHGPGGENHAAGSHGGEPSRGSTPGSHDDASRGSTPESHSSEPAKGSTAGSHDSEPAKGSTAESHSSEPSRGSTEAQHGFTASHSQAGMHSGAFSGFNHGGVTMANSSRGRSSFGGGGHMGGGHVGGGHGGGGRR
jgi:uncharacterized membrane protein YgcG